MGTYILILLLLTAAPGWAQTCYRPGGSAADYRYVPCNTGAQSMCCRTNDNNYPDKCRTDGLCQETQQDVIWRDSCTDPTWQSPQCLRLCIDGAGFGNDSIVTFCSDQSICCGYQNMTCCNTNEAVWISNGQVVTTSPGPSATSAGSSTTSPGPSATSAGLSTTSHGPSATSQIVNSENVSHSMGAKIGIGVAVPLVAIIIAISAAFIYIRRRRSRNAAHGNQALEPLDYNPEHKAELIGTVPTVNTTRRGPKKPELDAVETSVVAVLELDGNSARQEAQEPSILGRYPRASNFAPAPTSQYAPITELDAVPSVQALELDTTMPNPGDYTTQISNPAVIPLPIRGSKSEVIPNNPNLDPSPINATQSEEDDLQYQERRLREKRELLAEKERLALDEDRLRERRANLKMQERRDN